MTCADDLETLAAGIVAFGCIAAAMTWIFRRASRALDRWELRQSIERERPIP